jgi:hypothetical protein
MPIDGVLEAIEPLQIHGWAFDRSRPSENVKVQITLDDLVLAEGFAGQFRDDLAKNGVGDGRHSFSFELRKQLSYEEANRISARAMGADGAFLVLRRGPGAMSIRNPSEMRSTEAHLTSNWEIVGYVGAVHRSLVEGWVRNLAAPEAMLEVFAKVGDEELGRSTVDVFREDLRGNHGFVIELDVNRVGSSTFSDLEIHVRDDHGNEAVLPRRPHFTETIFPGPSIDRTQHPLFILGAARSGTSAVMAALRSASRYRGYDEGHVFPLLSNLLRTVEAYYSEAAPAIAHVAGIATIPRKYFQEGISSLFVNLMREKFETEFWVDKTPSNEMILAAPYLKKIWPSARFIFMKRRGLENLVSRQHKFSDDFASRCSDWANAMSSWRQIRHELKGMAIEIDQLAMAREPARVAKALGTFLALERDETDRLVTRLESTRVEQTSADIADTLDIAGVGWSDDEINMFHEICGTAMREYGYSEDKSYFVKEDVHRGVLAL